MQMFGSSTPAQPRRKVFISYHHRNDQNFKRALLDINELHEIFIDKSVGTDEIDEDLPDETIRRKIRDEYLKDSTVTILLAGTETKYRKHVDWELYSGMIDGSVNKKSGLIVVNLPTTGCEHFTTAHTGEKATVHPDCTSWMSITTRKEYDERYPHLPERIIDNLLAPKAKISVVPWNKFVVPENLRFLIEAAFQGRDACEYDLSLPMRDRNHNPSSRTVAGVTPTNFFSRFNLL